MMDSDFLLEWLNLALRWVHIFAGIMWVGATFFFTWLDGRFSELMEKKRNVYMVHSGGFYVVEKQKAPSIMSEKLHWFRWEAATTWLSGMLLLLSLYYVGGLMVEDLEKETTAMVVGIAAIILSWPMYDLLWRSALGRDERVGAAVSFVLIAGAAYGLNSVMGPRAMYIHVGSMLGTLMAANVWMIIIPSQRQMVAALAQGKEPDQTLAARAKGRSKHNTFMAVPVVFLMISNHFPTITYGTHMNWLVLAVMVLIGWTAAKFLRRA